jgi:hypothetical protein
MGNQNKKPTTARRAASFLAVLGALVMSSGVALMVTATPANANQGLSVCHPVNGAGQTGNGWNLIGPDHASTHIDESLYPDGTYWKHESNDGRHDVYASEDGKCPGAPVVEPDVATASATPIQPTCENPDGGYTLHTENATFTDTPAAVPGQTVHLTATANSGAEFAGGATTLDVPVTLAAAPTDCEVVTPPAVCDEGTDNAGQQIPNGMTAEQFCNAEVLPPVVDTNNPPPTVVVNPPKAHTPKAQTVTTPTVVHAGLAGVSSQDLRGEQGLALMVAGMVMLGAAGGLGLRLRRADSRI